MATLSTPVAPESPSGDVSRDKWLVSPGYDLSLIIFSSVLLVIPHVFSQIGELSNIVVDLVVTAAVHNLDVAFQGLNVWHSFQYLAVVLYINRVRSERGLIGSEYVARISRSGRSLYWMCFLFTLGAAAAYLLVHGFLILFGI